MSKGRQRRAWKAQAARKRDPWGQMQPRQTRKKGQNDKSRRWRDGEA
jgi:hypothetical protein